MADHHHLFRHQAWTDFQLDLSFGSDTYITSAILDIPGK